MFTFEENEVYLLENNEKIAYILYPIYKDEVRVIKKVYVDPSLRGQGMASKIMNELYLHFKKNNIKTIATCPYAVTWFERNTDKQDILVPSDEGVACSI